MVVRSSENPWEADNRKTTYHLASVDDTPLHRYWGRTLLFHGNADAAMETYREAWIAIHGNEEGLLEDLNQKRPEYARPFPSFELPDYEGGTLSVAQFQGDVILVAAWFPT